jgi:sphingomyelin phosphodiesterase acid-like 3
VDGNIPTFTVARVNPTSAILKDYDVSEASNQTGIDTHWTTEYNFGQTYGEPQFSSSNVSELIGKFNADGGAKTEASRAYIRNYFVGDMSREISPFWPEYVCALDHYTAKGFAACVCSTAK